jgi:hypothetical protein
MDQSQLQFWQFCDIAKCTPSAPDINLGMVHKKFYKHPQHHELRAQWVVERAKRVANQDLNLELVIAASKQEAETLRNTNSRTIATFKL